MSKRAIEHYLSDILESILAIEEYVQIISNAIKSILSDQQ